MGLDKLSLFTNSKFWVKSRRNKVSSNLKPLNMTVLIWVTLTMFPLGRLTNMGDFRMLNS